MERRWVGKAAIGIAAIAPMVVACSEESGSAAGLQGTGATGGTPMGAGGTGGGASGAGGARTGGATSSSGGSATGGSSSTVPATFVSADVGGYALGPAITATTNAIVPSSAGGCSVIVGVVRDFEGANEPGGHPDFETFLNPGFGVQGLVEANLGADGKPVYTGLCEVGLTTPTNCPDGQETTSKANFDQWYRSVPGVNEPFVLYLNISSASGMHSFQSSSFFPLDEPDAGTRHNFSFTTEWHLKFVYAAGQRFTFTGDDDVWVFVNGRIAIDLGGVHAEATGMLDLDSSAAALGLTLREEVSLDVFQAERHTDESNFGFETNIPFSNCGTLSR